MHNGALAIDYVQRAALRLKAIDALYGLKAWADVVCECQKAVELALRGLLRIARVDSSRGHDVSAVLLCQAAQLPDVAREHLQRMTRISRELGRHRELAFYGAEDLVPSEFYVEEDASRAQANARFVVETATVAMRQVAGER